MTVVFLALIALHQIALFVMQGVSISEVGMPLRSDSPR